MKDYEHLLAPFRGHLENYTKTLAHKEPKELYHPCRYILSLGGKRLRPLLALIGSELFEGNGKNALDAALCVELFHNFSLIHDDILDKALRRRNKPTVHTKWNTDIAILSGDALLVEAVKTLQSYKGENFRKLNTLFTRTATEVCEGQQMDMNFEKRAGVTVNDYVHMIRLKTAVLLGCSLQMGAITARATTQDQKHLYSFGLNLGIAFQLLDDYLDAFAPSASKFGKRPGGDILANKKTFLLLKALEQSNRQQRKELNELLKNKNAAGKVKAVQKLFRDTFADQLCLQEADKYTGMAISSLKRVKANELKKQQLERFALDLVKRQI